MGKRPVKAGDHLPPAIAASTRLLGDLLGDSTESVSEAVALIENGDQKAGLNLLASLDVRLADVTTLHRAILVIHRER